MKKPGPRFLGSLALLGAMVAGGCGDTSDIEPAGDGSDSPASAHVVERSSENGIETVRTVSGSVWGGNATLVEELAIGEEVGGDGYMFGSVTGAWATNDRIYVIDAQIPAVRAFDGRGEHLHDIGRPGQGPGEYGSPSALAVTTDGRVIVTDVMGSRLNIYGVDGELIEDWPLGSPKSGLGLVLSYDDEAYAQAWGLDEERMGMQAVGPDGPTSDLMFPPAIEYEPQTVSVGKDLGMVVPLSPAYAWAFAPGGEMIAGVGDAYRFEIHGRDGRAVAVEHNQEPTSVIADEADFLAEWASESLRMMNPDLRVTSADIPAHKPSFSSFYPDRAGRLWVVRQGSGRRDPDCIDADTLAPPQLMSMTAAGTYFAVGAKSPGRSVDDYDGGCWTDTFVFDLFDIRSGEFLGTVAPPELGFRAPLFADDDTVLAAVMDEVGTVRLKRYRLQVD